MPTTRRTAEASGEPLTVTSLPGSRPLMGLCTPVRIRIGQIGRLPNTNAIVHARYTLAMSVKITRTILTATGLSGRTTVMASTIERVSVPFANMWIPTGRLTIGAHGSTTRTATQPPTIPTVSSRLAPTIAYVVHAGAVKKACMKWARQRLSR